METLGLLLGGSWCLWWLYRLGVSLANALRPLKLPQAVLPGYLSSISVLVPVRNEMHQLPELLENLARLQTSVVEILIFDDASSDGSSAVLKQAQSQWPFLKVYDSPILPKNWLGKNHACWQLAQRAQGDWLLFIDADVRLSPKIPTQALGYAMEHRLDLLSIFPQQHHGSWGEALWVPLLNQVLLSGLYLPWVTQSQFSTVAAANGQFMLINKEAYFQLGGHLAVANHLPEDILLARKCKASGRRIGVLPPQKGLSCGMYRSGWLSFKGLMRNVVPALGGSASAIAWMAANLLSMLALLVFAPQWMWWGLLLPLASRIFVLLAAEKRPLRQLVLALPQLLCWPFLWMAALIAHQTNQISWKDRPVN